MNNQIKYPKIISLSYKNPKDFMKKFHKDYIENICNRPDDENVFMSLNDLEHDSDTYIIWSENLKKLSDFLVKQNIWISNSMFLYHEPLKGNKFGYEVCVVLEFRSISTQQMNDQEFTYFMNHVCRLFGYRIGMNIEIDPSISTEDFIHNSLDNSEVPWDWYWIGNKTCKLILQELS